MVEEASFWLDEEVFSVVAAERCRWVLAFFERMDVCCPAGEIVNAFAVEEAKRNALVANVVNFISQLNVLTMYSKYLPFCTKRTDGINVSYKVVFFIYYGVYDCSLFQVL